LFDRLPISDGRERAVRCTMYIAHGLARRHRDGRSVAVCIFPEPHLGDDKARQRALLVSLFVLIDEIDVLGLAVSREGNRIAAAVEFESVEPRSLFGAQKNEWSALEVKYASGALVALRGRGAGRWSTSEAVMADVFDVVRARAGST